MREAHAHLPMLGRSLAMLHVGHHTSVASLLDALSQEASRLDFSADSDWLLAVGLRVEGFSDDPLHRWPTRVQLDAVTSRPCCIMSFDHHSVVANTPAFAAAGIGLSDPDPPGGIMARDARTGLASGVLFESAAYAVWSAAPQPPESARPAQIIAALRHLSELGYTEVHDLLSPQWLGPILARLIDQSELTMTVRLYAPLAELEVHAAASSAWERGQQLLFAGGKVFADGTLNSGTAWMLEPYQNPLPSYPTGTALLSRQQLADAMQRCYALRLGLAVHAIGDGAVRATLDARAQLHSAVRFNFVTHAGPFLRIEHCELIDTLDTPRFAAMNAVASVQPCHLLTDIEVLRRQLPHRLHRVLPLRELIDNGCAPGELLWFGSDVPIVPADPADSLTAATVRGRSGTPRDSAIAPEQSLTLQECYLAFAAGR